MIDAARPYQVTKRAKKPPKFFILLTCRACLLLSVNIRKNDQATPKYLHRVDLTREFWCGEFIILNWRASAFPQF